MRSNFLRPRSEKRSNQGHNQYEQGRDGGENMFALQATISK